MTPTLASRTAANQGGQPDGGRLQRARGCGSHQTVAAGECAPCREERGLLQRTAAHPGHGDAAPPAVHTALAVPGRPLEPGERAFFESRYHHDFSDVRIHTGHRAAESARQADAYAYTVGRAIVFGEGRYLPGTPGGRRRILAHGLTHLVQQRGVTAGAVPLEAQADCAADAVLAGRAADVTPGAAASVQRQCGDRPVPGCEPGMPYLSIPSSSEVWVAYGKWPGLQYLGVNPISSYLVVDWWPFSSDGEIGTIYQLAPNGGNVDPAVWLALHTIPDLVTRGFQRTDILDSHRDHVYEIKPRRGARSGPTQLNRYLRQLRSNAPTAPAWMGERPRNWNPGSWSPNVPLLPVPSPVPGLFVCYLCSWPDEANGGVILYDIVCCPNWEAHAALAAAVVLAVALIVIFAAEIAAAAVALLAALAAGTALVAVFAAGIAALAPLFAAVGAAAAIPLIVIGMMESEGAAPVEPGHIAPLAAAAQGGTTSPALAGPRALLELPVWPPRQGRSRKGVA